MPRSHTRASVILFVLVCGFPVQSLRAGEHPRPATDKRPSAVTAQEAHAWERKLQVNPDDLAVREKLLNYYRWNEDCKTGTSEVRAEFEEKYEQQIFWLIEHHPESELGTRLFMQTKPSNGARGKRLWLQQVEAHPNDARVLRNAGEFFLYLGLGYSKLEQEQLNKALFLNPNDAEATEFLAKAKEGEQSSAGWAKKEAELISYRGTAQDAHGWEQELNTNPDNLAVREKLFNYYYLSFADPNLPIELHAELEGKRQQQVFWLIEHHPESELARKV